MPHIRSVQDRALIRTVRHLARQAGATHQQFEKLLDAYDEGVARGLSGAALKTYIAEDPVVSRFSPELTSQLDAEVYTPIIERGAEALAPTEPTADEDMATIKRAEALLRDDAKACWRDGELQEAYSEALERRQAAPSVEPQIDHLAIERDVAQRDCAKFGRMMRDPQSSREYWTSPTLQAHYAAAIERRLAGEAAMAASPSPAPGSPTEAASAAPPAAPASE
jgi:hypothetical protein